MSTEDIRIGSSDGNLPWNEVLARELDAADGNRDGKIKNDIWNGFIKKVGSRGNKISIFINVKNAAKSFNYYNNKKDVGIVDWSNWEELLLEYQKELGLVSSSVNIKKSKSTNSQKAENSEAAKEENPTAENPEAAKEENPTAEKPEAAKEENPTAENPEAAKEENPATVNPEATESYIPGLKNLSVAEKEEIIKARQKYDINTELSAYIEEKGYILKSNVNGKKTYVDKNKNVLTVSEYANGQFEISTALKTGQKVHSRIINSKGDVIQESEFRYEKKGKKEIEIRKKYNDDGSYEQLTFVNGEQVESDD